MPPGKIIPELAYPNLEAAVVWLCDTFGFMERLRIGNHRSQLVLEGESLIAKEYPVGDEATDKHGDHSIMVHIEGLDEHFRWTVQQGAKIISPPTDYPFGERQYSVEDIGGHIWTFSQTIADVDPRQWGGVIAEDERQNNPSK